MDKTFDNFKIDSQGMDNGYRWIMFTTKKGNSVKMQEGWGESVFQIKENVNIVQEAAKLIRVVSKDGKALVDSAQMSDNELYEFLRREPAWELQDYITAYAWFNKEVSMPEEYSFRPTDIKPTSPK